MTPDAPPAPPTAPPGFLARWAAALAVAGALGAYFLGVTFNPRETIRSDGLGYHIWTHAILKGDLSFAWFDGEHHTHSLHLTDPAGPRYACKYPPGVALVRLPVMACVVDGSRNGPPYSLAENVVCLALGAAALLGVVILGLLACRELGLPPWWSQFAVLVVTFGTGLFHYATCDAAFSHIYSALGTAFLVWQGARARRAGKVSAAGAAGVAAVATLMILVRITNVFILAFWVAGVGWRAWSSGRRPTAALAAVGGTLAGLGVTVGLNAHLFGRYTLNTYPGEGFVWDRPMMLSVLISEDRGLLTYYPVVGVALLVGLLVRPSRPAAVGLTLLVLFYAALYGYWESWHLGGSFGHRGFVDLVPLATPVLATALAALWRWRRWAALGVAAACVVLTRLTVLWMIDYWWVFLP